MLHQRYCNKIQVTILCFCTEFIRQSGWLFMGSEFEMNSLWFVHLFFEYFVNPVSLVWNEGVCINEALLLEDISKHLLIREIMATSTFFFFSYYSSLTLAPTDHFFSNLSYLQTMLKKIHRRFRLPVLLLSPVTCSVPTLIN